MKTRYNLELYGTLKLVDQQSNAKICAQENFWTATLHIGINYDVGMHWPGDHLEIPNYYFAAAINSLEKRLTGDQQLCKNFHKRRKNAGNVSGTCFIIRLLTRISLASSVVFFNKSELTKYDLQQKLIYELLRFRQHSFAVSATPMVCSYKYLHVIRRFCVHCGWWTPHQLLWNTGVIATSLKQKDSATALTLHFNTERLGTPTGSRKNRSGEVHGRLPRYDYQDSRKTPERTLISSK